MIYPDDYINQVVCGDYIEVTKGIPDNSVDLVIADPPYNLDVHSCSARSTGIYAGRDANVYQKIQDSQDKIDIAQFLTICQRVLKTFNGYFWCSRRQVAEYLNWAIEQNYYYDILTWVKWNPMPLHRNSLLPDTEYGIQIKEKGARHVNGLHIDNYRKSYMSSRVNGIDHPTPKPIELMRRHVRISSDPGDVILDPTCGSGTALVAAKWLERRYIGIDIEEKHCRLSRSQLKKGEIFKHPEESPNNS